MTGDLYFGIGFVLFTLIVVAGIIPLIYQIGLVAFNYVNDIYICETDAVDKLFPYAASVSVSSTADMAWLTAFFVGCASFFFWPVMVISLLIYAALRMARTSVRLSKHMKDTKAHGGSSNS